MLDCDQAGGGEFFHSGGREVQTANDGVHPERFAAVFVDAAVNGCIACEVGQHVESEIDVVLQVGGIGHHLFAADNNAAGYPGRAQVKAVAQKGLFEVLLDGAAEGESVSELFDTGQAHNGTSAGFQNALVIDGVQCGVGAAEGAEPIEDVEHSGHGVVDAGPELPDSLARIHSADFFIVDDNQGGDLSFGGHLSQFDGNAISVFGYLR